MRIPQRSCLGLVRGGDELFYSSCEETQTLLQLERRKKNLHITDRENRHKYVYIGSNEVLKHLITNHQGLMISAGVDVKECVPLVPETSFDGIRNCFETLDGFWNDKSVMHFRFLML